MLCNDKMFYIYFFSICLDITMNISVMSVLLCFIPALVEVDSQNVAKIRFMRETLPNNSYVDFNLVGATPNDSVKCRTDLSTCCSSEYGPDCGDWYFPNGTELPNFKNSDIHEVHKDKHVQLRRNNGTETAGIYRCEIETSAANNDSRETVYVGLYSSGGQQSSGHVCVYFLCVPLDNSFMKQIVCTTRELLNDICFFCIWHTCIFRSMYAVSDNVQGRM